MRASLLAAGSGDISQEQRDFAERFANSNFAASNVSAPNSQNNYLANNQNLAPNYPAAQPNYPAEALNAYQNPLASNLVPNYPAAAQPSYLAPSEATNSYQNPVKSSSRDALFNPRIPTPNRLFSADLSRPVSFTNSNNLIRKPGSFYQAIGEVIQIKGKVTDSFGVPIAGAVIDVWQTNSAGKYQTLIEEDSEFMDVNFNMSGKAITDNLGNYNFITIMPGSYLNRAPHINFNIYSTNFGRIETEMYFENHPYNESDYEYLSYSEKEKKLLTAKVSLSDIFDPNSYKICIFNIVMSGVHEYKSFGGI